MKQLLIYCLLFLPCFSQGQITVYNSSLRDITKNELYWGLDNIICVKGIDDSKSDVVIKMAKGEIEKSGINNYIVNVDYSDRFQKDTLTIYKKGKAVLAKYFEIKGIPYDSFYFQFGAKKNTVLTVREILISPYLRYIIPSSNYKDYKKIDYPKVSYFTIKILSLHDSEQSYSREVTGWSLGKEDREQIKKLHSGDKIVLENIRIVGQLLCPRDLDGSITITIE